MGQGITFHLPNILRMCEGPSAAGRLLLPGARVPSLYCCNDFPRTAFFLACTDE
ncbi:hypothetical protein VULLAG_LOCUS23629 [Vulpes lagopus]